MSKTAALQKSIAKEMTDAKLMIVKERNMPSHTKEKKNHLLEKVYIAQRFFFVRWEVRHSSGSILKEAQLQNRSKIHQYSVMIYL